MYLSVQSFLTELVVCFLLMLVHQVQGMLVVARFKLIDELTVLADDTSFQYFFFPYA